MGKTSLGLEENVEGALAYLFTWLSGILLFLLEKESNFVRFHALQSTITFIGWFVVEFILMFIPLFGWFISSLMWIGMIILWLYCMIKAYQGEKFKLPIVGDIAEKQVGGPGGPLPPPPPPPV